ncbi:hypothetical protein SLS62_010006 [Diatrype stigma]|uniref:Uncharacterized protein n=1 Tax=Diatrype stigma TaxID=117547 RepID=A0AAN9UJY1_9PEZI
MQRVVASRLSTHPEAIREVTEPPPEDLASSAARLTSPVKPTGKRKPAISTHEVQPEVSPQTKVSSIPSLPSVAKIAATTESSLERALDAVMKKLDEMETQPARQTHQPSATTLRERTNHSMPLPALKRVPDQEISSNKVTIWPPQPSNLLAEPRKLSRHRSIGQPPKSPPPDPTRKPSARPLTRPQGESVSRSVSKGKSLAAMPQQKTPNIPEVSTAAAQAVPPNNTEQILDDLDTFFDHDDANISDKDVLQGLQIAVHAAADDFYDAYIRYKTGMRIRRFLADLQSVDLLQRENMFKPVPRNVGEELGRRRQTGNGNREDT